MSGSMTSNPLREGQGTSLMEDYDFHKLTRVQSVNVDEDGEAFIDLNLLPQDAQMHLRKFDLNSDGKLSIAELNKLVAHHKGTLVSLQKSKTHLFLSLFAGTILLALLGMGVVMLAMHVTRETTVDDNGNLRTVKNVESIGTVVATKNTDIKLNDDGQLQSNVDNMPVQTSLAQTTLNRLDSDMPDEVWEEMTKLQLYGDNGAYMRVSVQGYARIPTPEPLEEESDDSGISGEMRSSSVIVFTNLGQVIWHGENVVMEEEMIDKLDHYGFAVPEHYHANNTEGALMVQVGRRRLNFVVVSIIIGTIIIGGATAAVMTGMTVDDDGCTWPERDFCVRANDVSVKNFEELRWGPACATGFYAGNNLQPYPSSYDLDGGSLEAYIAQSDGYEPFASAKRKSSWCANACMAEPECAYFQYIYGAHTCNRFDYTAGWCADGRGTGGLDSVVFKKKNTRSLTSLSVDLGLGYQYLGRGYCKQDFLRGWEADDKMEAGVKLNSYRVWKSFAQDALRSCAAKCDSEAECLYFGLWKGNTCSLYGAGAAADCEHPSTRWSGGDSGKLGHALYKKKTGLAPEFKTVLQEQFTTKRNGYCNAGYYTGWEEGATEIDKQANRDARHSFMACVDLCRSEDNCHFIAFRRGSTCSRYDSRAGDCSGDSFTEQADHMLLQKKIEYVEITTGTCSSNGMSVIPTIAECSTAAGSLGKTDTTVTPTNQSPRPEGCYYYHDSQLWFSANNPANIGIGNNVGPNGEPRRQICKQV